MQLELACVIAYIEPYTYLDAASGATRRHDTLENRNRNKIETETEIYKKSDLVNIG